MNLNKKIILIFFLIIPLLIPFIVLADTAPTVDITVVLNRITNWLLGFLMAFAVLMLIVAGYYFISAQGDPEKVQKARHFVLWALVGVAVGISSKAIATFVEKIVRGLV